MYRPPFEKVSREGYTFTCFPLSRGQATVFYRLGQVSTFTMIKDSKNFVNNFEKAREARRPPSLHSR